jgi:Ca2+-binding EF-hand superfamily protein
MADLDHIVEDIMKKYDLDASGTLSSDDTVPLYAEIRTNRPDLGLDEAGFTNWFDAIDHDHDGTISKEELKGYLAGVNYAHHHH